MTLDNRDRALSNIRESIARNGYHLYVVSGKSLPRFAYTIEPVKPIVMPGSRLCDPRYAFLPTTRSCGLSWPVN